MNIKRSRYCLKLTKFLEHLEADCQSIEDGAVKVVTRIESGRFFLLASYSTPCWTTYFKCPAVRNPATLEKQRKAARDKLKAIKKAALSVPTPLWIVEPDNQQVAA